MMRLSWWMGCLLLIACSGDDGSGGAAGAGSDSVDPGPDTGSDADPGSGTDPGSDTDTGSDTDADPDTGSDPDTDPGSDTDPDTDPDSSVGTDVILPGESEAELAAFLEAMSYREAGWTAQTAAPRERSSDVSPHGRVRVWRNDTLLASQAAGNGTDLDAPKHDTGSMVIKEFYDDADALIGAAAMLKLEGDMREWAYYCGGPDDRCMDSSPVHGIGFGVSCSFCHGGLVFTNSP